MSNSARIVAENTRPDVELGDRNCIASRLVSTAACFRSGKRTFYTSLGESFDVCLQIRRQLACDEMALEADTIDQVFFFELLDKRKHGVRLVIDTLDVEVVLNVQSIISRKAD